MIADRLRKARLMAGLTQKSLADATQIPLSWIRGFENGNVIPSSRQLLTIARMCGLSTEYLFREDTVKLIDTHWCTSKGDES